MAIPMGPAIDVLKAVEMDVAVDIKWGNNSVSQIAMLQKDRLSITTAFLRLPCFKKIG